MLDYQNDRLPRTLNGGTPKKTKRARKRPLKKKIAKLAFHRKAALACGAIGIALLGLSLWHISEGISKVTGDRWFLALLLAIGIDAGFVVLEISGVSIAGKPIMRQLRWLTVPTIVVTLALSAALNTMHHLASAVPKDGTGQALAICLGVFIPGMAFVLFQVAAKVWLYGGSRQMPE